jgi:hypothetical protein
MMILFAVVGAASAATATTTIILLNQPCALTNDGNLSISPTKLSLDHKTCCPILSFYNILHYIKKG